MRVFAALVAGLLLSVTTFAAGVLGTMSYLSRPLPAPRGAGTDVAELWTSEPTPVEVGSQRLQRIPPRASENAVAVASTVDVSDAKQPETLEGADDEVAVDRLATGSTEASAEEEQAFLPEKHVNWCASRYNSYRIDDDTYQPFRGARKRCRSPYPVAEANGFYLNDGAAQEVLQSSRRAIGQGNDAAEVEAAELSDHERDCSERYRSYRPEDNSYQPFDGGPRRQCR